MRLEGISSTRDKHDDIKVIKGAACKTEKAEFYLKSEKINGLRNSVFKKNYFIRRKQIFSQFIKKKFYS